MASFTTTFMAGGGFASSWAKNGKGPRPRAKPPRILSECRAHSLKLGRAHRLPDDFGVQARLISEVVVDGGDVSARSIADFSDSGVMKTKLSEHFSGSLD